MWNGLSTENEIQLAKMEKIRRAGYNDLYTFTKYVMGYDSLEIQPHKEVCDFIIHEPDLLEWFKLSRAQRARRAQEHGNIKKLLMLPRGSFKSTIATVAFPIWAHWHDINLRILIDNESFKNSKNFLSEQKGAVKNNTLLKALCIDDNGKYILEPNEKVAGGWTEDSIIYNRRTIQAKESSVFCSGVETAATGMHPDIIIMDDLVSERNVTTKDQILKVKQHYKFAYSLLEPGGLLIIIGTRYHMDDMYADILKDPTFKTMVRPARLPNGQYFFPARLGEKRLRELEHSQGSYIFNSQYMLNPLSSDTATFKAEHIKTYKNDDEVPHRVYNFITVDLAISQKETADYTVVCTSSVDSDGNIYIREYERERFTPPETIDIIFRMAHKWKPLKVGIETVAFQKSMIYFIRAEMRARGCFIPLVELKADTDKIRRAMALAPFVENGAFFIREGMKEMYDEMVQFPFGKHDDTVDVAAYILQIMRRPGKHQSKGIGSVYEPRNSVTGY